MGASWIDLQEGRGKSVTADDIITVARSALDTPFFHQGRRAGVALDCAGLVCHVCETLCIPYVDQVGYGRRPLSGLIESALDSQPSLTLVRGKLNAGDVLLMRFLGDPQHLAIFTGTTIIHALEQIGKVCEHGYIGPWPRRFIRAYRFKGIES